MVNKTLKVALATLTIVASSQVYAAANRDQTISPVTCCVGYNAAACACTLAGSGKARGDVVPQEGANQLSAKSLAQSGKLMIPQVGQKLAYNFAGKRIVFASYNLVNIDSSIPSEMKKILRKAKAKYPQGQALIWTGQSQGNDNFTELTETVVGTTDVATSAAYTADTETGILTVTLPNAKVNGQMVPGEVVSINLFK